MSRFKQPSKEAVDVILSGQSEAVLRPAFLSPEESDSLLGRVLEDVEWKQQDVTIFGKASPMPRKTMWRGEDSYRYSGTRHEAVAWTRLLDDVRSRLEAALRPNTFNCVLGNLYRDGKDYVGWHADNEPCFGDCPVIASLSLGAARRFVFRRKDDHSLKVERMLTHGSLLVMSGRTQDEWEHSVPRSLRIDDRRVNFTFRTMIC